ncbi:hypothetical protein KAFR_0G02920 [Kazachstania africana CBS 2517]|uniref:assimilatory sulfite reductase (NADPH) n=1 Tax=Kazachstania africana (strain ATCC 22294 / BCRC 22015 / CBS 2517 / CECT 1963 / NBRC 1671 / NRRL Y-8276) TaxID=1071382 RepID=H2AY74_KAZAF|nr:hypothetical protein KAFR_0G02920 [Kazachstania africana CBS 2517]CCF59324.1 hypothetical protein KAFR_0G02920 [Kazachstania africana CBS 2517]
MILSEFDASPFGSTSNAKALSKYGTPVEAISSVIYNNVDDIFVYKTFSEEDLLYGSIKNWAHQEQSKHFQELDIRSGAGLSPLGFASGLSVSKLVGIVTPGYALPYFINTFNATKQTKSRFFFNVGALGYNQKTGSITTDYVSALDAASKLGFNVISPISTNEVQATTLLSLAVAKFGNTVGTVNLFDGVSYSKSILPITEDISKYSGVFRALEKVLPPNASFDEVLFKFNELTGLRLFNFHYSGKQDVETVFVIHGSLESELFTQIAKDNEKIGILSVRVPIPFDIEKFVTKIPKTTKRIVVVNQTLSTSAPTTLKSQVSAALFYHGNKNIIVSEFVYQPDFIWSPLAVEKIISSFAQDFQAVCSPESKNFIFWSSDKSVNINIAPTLAEFLSNDNTKALSLRSKFDNVTNAGIFQAQISYAPKDNFSLISNIDFADVSIVEDVTLLKKIDVNATIKKGGSIIILSSKSLKNLNFSQLETFTKDLGIPESFLVAAIENEINFTFIDLEALNEQAIELTHIIGYTVLTKCSSASPEKSSKHAIQLNIDETSLETALLNAVKNVFFTNIPKIEATSEETEELPIFITETSFTPNNSEIQGTKPAQISKSKEIAKKLAFKEAFGLEKHVRPDLPVKNFIVKVKENRRVTPSNYDRYIFHIEFDITGTGLKYYIGEALGIHARNDEKQVLDFLIGYGLNPEDIVLVPNKDNSDLLESRTVLHAFTENLDLFGKPPKKFYETLSEFAEDEKDKKRLQELVSAEGAVELKRYQDVEYYTYADIFQLFTSARPSVEHLVTMISPLKRREYSIASSQKVHSNEVHLLIVVVDWIDNRGRKRFGQASKFISDLQIGQEVVVSVKPSVMKLPPLPSQPVIMSGLGTGLAPFKAIVEEKLWQKQQGYEIGDVFLYLGSRHKREEYLYGELWEAYKDAGIITHIGAAFSRDQPEKIYIQDCIRENLAELKTAMIDQEGSFYLCGPTWPVPDITQALQDIIAADAEEKGEKVDLNAAIEELKDTSRYILEVY